MACLANRKRQVFRIGPSRGGATAGGLIIRRKTARDAECNLVSKGARKAGGYTRKPRNKSDRRWKTAHSI